MASINKKLPRPKTGVRVPNKTHGGAQAASITPEQALRRSLMACMLWEKPFYEDGEDTAARIKRLVPQVDPQIVADMAVEARTVHKLRHAPLWVVNAMLEYPDHRALVGSILPKVIKRPDEMGELLAMYFGGEKRTKPIGSQLRKGLTAAFKQFDAYQLAKYKNVGQINITDVYRLIHPKPDNSDQEVLWQQLREGCLPIPYTWETELSSVDQRGKKQKWTELLRSDRMPAYALLSNLRNIAQADCDLEEVFEALNKMDGRMIMPFRYFSAYRAAPMYKLAIDQAMRNQFIKHQRKIGGKTIIVVDVSGSMSQSMSSQSRTLRMDAAAALGAIGDLICENARVYATAGSDSRRTHATRLVAQDKHGIELAEHITRQSIPLGGGGIFLTQCLDYIKEQEGDKADRIIVITDEQDCSAGDRNQPHMAQPWGSRGNYMVNVSVEKHGIGYGEKWTHFDTLSEAIFHYILHVEDPTPAKLKGEDSLLAAMGFDIFDPTDGIQ